jgi:hypothetical protein
MAKSLTTHAAVAQPIVTLDLDATSGAVTAFDSSSNSCPAMEMKTWTDRPAETTDKVPLGRVATECVEGPDNASEVERNANHVVGYASDVNVNDNMESQFVATKTWDDLPSELLDEIIDRLAEGCDQWPERAGLVACGGVCSAWRDGVRNWAGRHRSKDAGVSFVEELIQVCPPSTNTSTYCRQ